MSKELTAVLKSRWPGCGWATSTKAVTRIRWVDGPSISELLSFAAGLCDGPVTAQRRYSVQFLSRVAAHVAESIVMLPPLPVRDGPAGAVTFGPMCYWPCGQGTYAEVVDMIADKTRG